MQYTTDGESTAAYTSNERERTINENQGGRVVVRAKRKGPVLIIDKDSPLKVSR
jgi:hypothetical protein